MPPKEAEEPATPLRKCVDWIRTGRNGPETRSSVLAGTRVDMFRGKDWLRVLSAKPPPGLDEMVPPSDSAGKDPAKKLEEQIMKLGVRALLPPPPACALGQPRRTRAAPPPPDAPCAHARPQFLCLQGGMIGRVDRTIKERSKGA